MKRTAGAGIQSVCVAGMAIAGEVNGGAMASGWRLTLIAVLATLATFGGLITIPALLEFLDHPGPRLPPLRGGAVIGLLERALVFTGVAAGMPEVAAIVIAVKALGRYPELRAEADDAARLRVHSAPGAEPRPPAGNAERFIIGTLASMLWAGLCAGALRLALG